MVKNNAKQNKMAKESQVKKLPPLGFEPQSFKVISLSIAPCHQVLGLCP